MKKNRFFSALLLLVVSCLFFDFQLFAQDYLKIPGLDQITSVDSGKIIHAHVLNKKISQRLKPNLFYYWFTSGKISMTQGGYSGKLLNGTFEEYFENKNLSRKGEFINGLKEGLWKEWYFNGISQNSFFYSKGTRSGRYTLFDTTGNLAATGFYKNGQLSGTQNTYSQGKLKDVHYYKNGIALSGTKHNIFRKIFATIKHFISSIF